jgi:hypothetical protein
VSEGLANPVIGEYGLSRTSTFTDVPRPVPHLAKARSDPRLSLVLHVYPIINEMLGR